MKRKIYYLTILLLFFSINNIIEAQTQVWRQTPKGDNVRAYSGISEWSGPDKKTWTEYTQNTWPNATMVDSASKVYNCHAYAWHVSESGDKIWIGYYSGQENDEDIYWTAQNPSYIETTEANASKISYYEDNHSAIQTSTQGIYISKWGNLALMQHARNYGPEDYEMDDRKYYKLNPEVPGTTIALCEYSQRTYSTDTEISGSDYYWTRNESLLDYVSGQDSPDYRIEGKSGYGDAWVQLQITTPSGEVATTLKKYFRVGIFQNTVVTGQAAVCPDELYTYTAQITGGHYPSYSYSWTYPSRWSNNSQWDNNILLQTPQYNMTYGTVRVSVTNACGTSGYSGMTVYPGYCGGRGGYYSISPNPADDYVEISIDESKLAENKIDEYEVRIYNSMNIMVSQIKTRKPTLRIDTNQFINGIYTVHFITGDKLQVEQLVISH